MLNFPRCLIVMGQFFSTHISACRMCTVVFLGEQKKIKNKAEKYESEAVGGISNDYKEGASQYDGANSGAHQRCQKIIWMTCTSNDSGEDTFRSGGGRVGSEMGIRRRMDRWGNILRTEHMFAYGHRTSRMSEALRQNVLHTKRSESSCHNAFMLMAHV